MGPQNTDRNTDRQLESCEDMVFKLHTVKRHRKKIHRVSEERRDTLILSEQGEGTWVSQGAMSAKTGVPSMHLATEWTQEGVETRPVGRVPSPGVSAAPSS